MVLALKHDVAGGQLAVHVAELDLAGAHQVAGAVARLVGAVFPVVLVVYQDLVVQGLAHVDDRGQLLVGDLHGLDAGRRGLLGLGHHDGHLVAHVAHGVVQDHGVVRRALQVGLAGQGKAVVGHVVGPPHGHDAGDGQGLCGVDGLHAGVGLVASHHAHDQGICRGQVVHVGGLAGEKGIGVLLHRRGRDARAAVDACDARRCGPYLVFCGKTARRQGAVWVLVARQEAPDRAHLPGVARAAAQVARKRAANLGVGGVGVLAVQGKHVHLKSGRAKAALLGAFLGHALGKKLAGGPRALKGGELVAVDARHVDRARQHGLAVQPHGAQAAVAGLAAALHALDAVRAAPREDGLVGLDVLGHGATVKGERDLH